MSGVWGKCKKVAGRGGRRDLGDLRLGIWGKLGEENHGCTRVDADEE
jgi:hypothetical protein